MAESVEKWVPITELPSVSECGQDARLTWDFELPPTVDAERLVFNTRMLGRIQSVAAFKSSHVIAYQGETTQYTPGVSGINSDGTAKAAMSGQLNKAPKTDTRIQDEVAPGPLKDYLMRNYFRAYTINALNRAELASSVADGRDSGKSRETRWASAIDDALGQSLRESARQHLLERQKRSTRLIEGGLYSLYIANLAELAKTHDVTNMAIFLGSIAAVTMLQEKTTQRRTGHLLSRERRWSLAFFGDMQPDRYALASVLTHTGTLVKARK